MRGDQSGLARCKDWSICPKGNLLSIRDWHFTPRALACAGGGVRESTALLGPSPE